MRRLAYAALAVWVGRWAALELASYAGRKLLPEGPPPKDSERQPGLMPLRAPD